MSQYIDSGNKSFKCSAAIAANLRVQATSSGLAVAGQTDITLGVLRDASFAAGDYRDVRLITKQGTQQMVASGAITALARIYPDNGGKITSTIVGTRALGIALEAATADGDLIEVLVVNDPQSDGSIASGVPQDVWTASATQNYALGSERVLPDGRKFRYAQAGAANITRALMQQTAVLDAKFLDITQTGHAQVIGATSITVLVTTGSAVAANYFAGGKLVVTTGTNAGDVYHIKSSVIEGTDTLLDLVLNEPLRNAIAATDKISIVPNRWKSTVVVPTTTITSLPAGVPLIDVTAANYYWAQTRGPAPLIVDTGDTIVVGSKVGIPATDAVAGSCGVTTATAYAFPVYGTCQWIATAGEPAVVFLELE